MKTILLIGALVLSSLMIGCGGGEVDTSKQGLDLQAVLALAKTSENPKDFEAKLNQKDGVDNLDLNGDGQVDYISVDEYEAQGSRAITLYVAYDASGNKQQVAEISCDREGEGTKCEIVGNDKVYGNNPVYTASADNGNTNLLMWYLVYRAMTPYHTEYYNYNTPRYSVRDYGTYSSSVGSTYSKSDIKPATLSSSSSTRIASSPNAGKSSPSISTRSSSSYSSSSSSRPSSSSSSSRSSSSSSSSSRSSSSSSGRR